VLAVVPCLSRVCERTAVAASPHRVIVLAQARRDGACGRVLGTSIEFSQELKHPKGSLALQHRTGMPELPQLRAQLRLAHFQRLCGGVIEV
jgi:hypothetical protein